MASLTYMELVRSLQRLRWSESCSGCLLEISFEKMLIEVTLTVVYPPLSRYVNSRVLQFEEPSQLTN